MRSGQGCMQGRPCEAQARRCRLPSLRHESFAREKHKGGPATLKCAVRTLEALNCLLNRVPNLNRELLTQELQRLNVHLVLVGDPDTTV